MKFLMITHNWFVDSKGFEVEQIEAKDEKDAKDQMDLITFRKQGGLRHAASKLIILENEDVFANRELTWTERLTGKLKC